MLGDTRKGQYQVLEHVLLFGAGLAVAMGFLYTFENFSEDIKNDVRDQHMEMLGKQVHNGIQNLLAADANGQVRVSLPPNIAGEEYDLQFEDEGIAIYVGQESHLTTIYGLEKQYDFEGAVTGDRDAVIIEKNGRRISMGGS